MKISSTVSYVKILTITVALFCNFQAVAQSPMSGVLPMQFNPAFAGATGSPRVGVSTHLSSYSKFFNRQNYAFSYDNFMPKLKSGIGIHGGYTRLARNEPYADELGNTHDVNFGLSVAPKFSFKGKYTLSPAVEINANLKNTNYEHFSQKLDRVKTSLQPQLRFGIALNGRKFYIGVSYHINGSLGYELGGRPTNMGGDRIISTSPRSYLQMGYNFQRRDDSKFSFSPQIVFLRLKTNEHYGNQEYNHVYHVLTPILNFRYKHVCWGLSYEGYEGVKAMIGWQNKNMKISFITSGTSNGQLSLRYIFNTKSTSDLNKVIGN